MLQSAQDLHKMRSDEKSVNLHFLKCDYNISPDTAGTAGLQIKTIIYRNGCYTIQYMTKAALLH